MRKQGVSFTADIRAVSLDYYEVGGRDSNFRESAGKTPCVPAQKSEEPFVELSVGKTEKAGLLLISISNSCTEKPEIPSSLRVHKGPHGIGLRSVRRTVGKYNGNIEQSWEERTRHFPDSDYISTSDATEKLKCEMSLVESIEKP